MAKLLNIEDESDLRQVLGYNLTQAGHEALTAETGAIGLRLAREQRPDLVLLDLMLPDLSGTEICRKLRDCAPIVSRSSKSPFSWRERLALPGRR